MGCCESTPDVPDVIIPDPGYEEEAVFTIRDLSMFNSDYEVLRGADPDPSGDRWLFLNSRKSRSDTIVEVENYVRKNPDDPKRGEVLYKAVFTGKPRFEETQSYPVGQQNIGMVFQALFTGQSPAQPNSQDVHYIQMAKRRDHGADRTRLKKWQLNTSARITAGPTRVESELIGNEYLLLKIYAAGAAVCTYDRQEDKWQRDIFEFVDCVDFQLTKADGEVVDEWRVPGDSFGTPPTSFETKLFGATKMSDGMTKEGDKTVKTNAPFDPVLALLVAHLMTSEYSVTGIKKDFSPQFPASPGARGGGGAISIPGGMF